jgi:hypothetical protein
VARVRRLALLILCWGLFPGPAAAEWQIKPFAALTFGGATTFNDLDFATDKRHTAVGVNGALIGDVIGIEADFARVPGFFQQDVAKPLVLSSSVTTLTGNVIVTLPRRLTQYTLRPYFVGGAGLMRVRVDDVHEVLPISSNLATLDFGGGVTGFLSNRFGLNWDIRRFQSIHGKDAGIGISEGAEQLSFWRASMALAIRY